MRYIVVPSDITITNLVTGELMRGAKGDPLTADFRSFVYQRLGDAKFIEGKQGSDAAFYVYDVKAKFDAQPITPGTVFAVEDEDWKRLVESTRNPTGGYRSEVMVSFVPFMRAVLDALTTPPAVDTVETPVN